MHPQKEEPLLPPALPPNLGLLQRQSPNPALHPWGQQTAPIPGFLQTLGSDTLASERLVLLCSELGWPRVYPESGGRGVPEWLSWRRMDAERSYLTDTTLDLEMGFQGVEGG